MIDTLDRINEIELTSEVMKPKVQVTPEELYEMHPISPEMAEQIRSHREQVADIINGKDPRLLLIVGPCSLDDKHEPGQTPPVLEFAQSMHELSQQPEVRENALVVMRCPPAKPRTSVGWRGLEQTDLVRAHELLHGVVSSGLPLAIDVMNEKHLARYGDLQSLGWIGARDMTVTGFRHTLSAHPELPVLVKNNEYGDVNKAIESIETIGSPHDNVEVQMQDGRTGYIDRSSGNPNTGVIFRGGADSSPAEFEQSLLSAQKLVNDNDKKLVVDCTHNNGAAHSGGKKTVEGQIDCIDHVLDMMRDGQLSGTVGVMIEGYINAGKDESLPGFSSTDPCVPLDVVDHAVREFAAQHGKVA